jgi:hypothetical protein
VIKYTEEHIDFIRNLWRNTAKSDSEIAVEFVSRFKVLISRNAVIGIRKRNDISRPSILLSSRETARLRHSRVSRGRTVARASRPAPIPDVEMPRDVSHLFRREEGAEEGITIMELRSSTCRWPLGVFSDHPPYRYCGQQTEAGTPYCVHHNDVKVRK